jgi:hypothetical protein
MSLITSDPVQHNGILNKKIYKTYFWYNLKHKLNYTCKECRILINKCAGYLIAIRNLTQYHDYSHH